ncbi:MULTISPECIES: hypothetical protein [unclassified Moorena]|uniref:Uncharacterized protein n=1 Tax=Moorena producens 3L TaxID=489825 RepID=F4XXG3_9CYAN|nr:MULTISPECIES: hypothetical protein [unclassified Moorena]EGJ30641.1 hypothetical protein LYNGBM3L_48330 [Moorena producens 3L]NEP33039.1 hypothetical protein [Moorena sp. SIO3B2]NEQ12732.1 hypothetical protein [Moorena sp. SIO3E2]NES45353.1 hypothetical protein [Moorena sp. SIO2C4]
MQQDQPKYATRPANGSSAIKDSGKGTGHKDLIGYTSNSSILADGGVEDHTVEVSLRSE